jgi:hypothetical protein
MTKEKSAAILTIKAPGSMTLRGRRDIAHWLRRQAAHFQGYGSRYTKGTFTARYIIIP